jgi:predicted lipid-binding transport protein (Tim44 family)
MPAQPPSRGFFGSLMTGIAGFALGGLIGSLLFGGMGRGFGGGFGLLELLLIGGAIAMLVMMFRRRRAEQPTYATASGPAPVEYPAGGNGGNGQYSSSYGATAAPPAATAPPGAAEYTPAAADLDRGLSHIRQMDPAFDEFQFTATATAVFMRIQGAWPTGSLDAVRDALAPELAAEMGRECEQLRAQGRTNRIEQIDVERAQVTEAWQEGGQDYVTVLFSASMVDYVVDAIGNVVEGSRTTPNRVEEFWTFTRPVGPNRWKLTAIQQPA